MVIVNLYNNDTKIWVSLFHELHPVLQDLETISKTKYHLSGESDLRSI